MKISCLFCLFAPTFGVLYTHLNTQVIMSKKIEKAKRKKFFGAKFTSTISVALVLFVLGLMAVGVFITAGISTKLREQFSVTIVLKDQVEEGSAQRFCRQLKNESYAKEVRYISKKDAIQTLTKELGENPEDFLGYNPLYASVEMHLHAPYAVNDSLKWIEARLKSRHSQEILSVDYPRPLLEMVNANMRRLGIVLAALALLLLIISFSLINNTIRLMLHSERFLIHTMCLVGATSWFIRRPFIRSCVWSGIFAAFLAMLALGGTLYYCHTSGVLGSVLPLLFETKTLMLLGGCVLSLGIVIPALAAWRATSRFLKMKVDDLYLL